MAHLKKVLSRKEYLYALIALSCGTVMAVVNPPFAGVPDEQAHYWKAWAVAVGNIRCRRENTIPLSAYDLPRNGYPPKVSVPGVGERIVFHGTLEKIFEPDAAGLTNEGRTICNATPLGYLPQALGLRIGGLFRLNAASSFYLARITNLIASVAIVSSAIRIIPFGKILLLVIGLLPMTIQQFSSLSYDPLHISLSFLFLAQVLRRSNTPRPVDAGELATLAAIGLLAVNVKLGYAGLALLIFLIPQDKFGSRRRYWLWSTGFLVVNAVVFAALYQFFMRDSASSGTGAGISGVNAAGQVSHVIGSPRNFFMVFVNTVYGNMNFYLESFLFKPGWLIQSLPPLWYLFVIAGMVMLVRNETEDVDLTRRQRYVLLLVFLVNVLAVFFSLYIGWTRVGDGIVQGVQGRYLLGVFPLLLFFFYKDERALVHEFVRKHLQALLVCFYLTVFAGAFLAIYRIYYDKNPTMPLTEKISEKLLGSP
jgi:uncharacterized membrane protein